MSARDTSGKFKRKPASAAVAAPPTTPAVPAKTAPPASQTAKPAVDGSNPQPIADRAPGVTPAPPAMPVAKAAGDPDAGKVFKPINSTSTASPPAKRGPGRPRKEPAKGDAGRPAARPEPTAARPGSHVTAYSAADENLSTDAVKGLLRTAGIIEGAIAGLVMRVDIGQAIKIWQFSETELALLTKPATRVANKYLPSWALDYADEIELAGILAPIMLNKIYAMIALKNPALLAQLAAGFMGGGQQPKQPAATVQPNRPQAVPIDKKPAPRTEPEPPAKSAAGEVAEPDPVSPALVGEALDFLAGAADPLAEVRHGA